MTRNIVFK